jgi:DNA mismatch repair protein MutS
MKTTPMMEQFMTFKRQYPDKVVLFRMGDFFETFGDDAKIASKVLNITLTSRDKNVDPTPLAGFPHHAIDQYLPKLVEAGYCVVVVDQLEDPKFAKGIVKRGVTRIVTPGTIDTKDNSPKNLFLMSIVVTKSHTGVALSDISTGKMLTSQSITKGVLENEQAFIDSIINSFDPAEILITENEQALKLGNLPIQLLPKEYIQADKAEKTVRDHFKIKNLTAIGLENLPVAVSACSLLLNYIQETQKVDPSHINKLEIFKKEGTMVLDRATIRNLELISNAYDGTSNKSLFEVLNECKTNMGKRLLYSWILNPLIKKVDIDKRLTQVKLFIDNPERLLSVRNALSEISDIERIIGKIGLNRVNARDYKALEHSLEEAEKIEELKNLSDKLSPLKSLIQETIIDTPPLTITEGHIIKEGFNKELDEIRFLSSDSKNWVKDFIQNEREKTGISSIKMGFNKVFGYYIEITNSHKEKVPDYFIRKQTLVNCERYITQELKQKEDIILNAEERLSDLEYKIFQSFRETSMTYLTLLQKISQEISQIDVLSNFAYIAREYNYCQPEIFDFAENGGLIEITDGRHPVIERFSTEKFIPNDTILTTDARMAILTGPNMSGKSTYIRQVALITLLAQLGSYIPATSAKISITDRIFTRVGAYDDLSKGRSTFMVEMEEAANIANNATRNSLVVLDEIGRGTSTYDGVSIAWALAEYLVNEIGARTLFATHYHELLKLADKYTAVKNFNVAVEEDEAKDAVIFLRKIVEGGTDRSYGIYVAKMAGLPDKVILKAKEILYGFEQESMFSVKNDGTREISSNTKHQASKLASSKGDATLREAGSLNTNLYGTDIFGNLSNGIIGEIEKVDTNNLTPVDALNTIVRWKKSLGL